MSIIWISNILIWFLKNILLIEIFYGSHFHNLIALRKINDRFKCYQKYAADFQQKNHIASRCQCFNISMAPCKKYVTQKNQNFIRGYEILIFLSDTLFALPLWRIWHTRLIYTVTFLAGCWLMAANCIQTCSDFLLFLITLYNRSIYKANYY